MRAKTINETQNFERGIDPKHSMGVGQINQIKKFLDKIYEDDSWMEYKIISPDRIEISYKEKWKEQYPKDFKNKIWILQYEEKERFFVREAKEEMSSWNHSLGTKHFWEIVELTPFISNDPSKIKFEEKRLIEMSKQDPHSIDKINIMANALNEYYGKTKGFKYIRTENES